MSDTNENKYLPLALVLGLGVLIGVALYLHDERSGAEKAERNRLRFQVVSGKTAFQTKALDVIVRVDTQTGEAAVLTPHQDDEGGVSFSWRKVLKKPPQEKP